MATDFTTFIIVHKQLWIHAKHTRD